MIAWRRRGLGAALLGAALAAAAALPATSRERQTARCVAALESQTRALAAQARSGDEAALPLLQSQLESAAAFVGDNYLHGDRDNEHARSLLDEARSEHQQLDPTQAAARQSRCAAEGAQLLAAASGLQRAVLKRFAKRRMDRLLGG